MIPPLTALAKPLYLGAHTLGRMEPRQIAGIGTRTAREFVVPRLPVDFDGWYERRVPEDPAVRPGPIAGDTATLRSALGDGTRATYRERARGAADGAPTFLNRTLRVGDGTTVDWYDDRFAELPLLWPLKLYAFQPLAWACLGFESGAAAPGIQSAFDAWIRDWVDSVGIGSRRYLRRAWTPWAVSLRILHWCRYLCWREGTNGRRRDDLERTLARAIYKNALFLSNHVERDVGGNHLVENGAALVAAGVFFGERTWTDAGTSVLTAAADDQFLADGCHFERSPMYHVLTLTRYLTVCAVLGESHRPVPTELRATARRATAFLKRLRPPDGRIPLLNDSVYGQALPLDDCLRYAEATGIATGDQRSESRRTAAEGRTSNYRWLRTDGGAMLVDGGRVGPPHLPGHSHSDTLTFLLWLDDRPVVTDTGTFGYVAGPRRDYARGVRGHNTVQVGEAEPIAIGGTYLMGPRPVPTTRFESGAVSVFEGRYEAAPFSGPTYTHHRAAYAGDRWWVVDDTVTDHGGNLACSRLHLHPDVEPSIESTGRVRLAVGGDDAFVYPLESARIGTTTSRYFPRFGTAIERPTLELHAADSDTDPATLGFLVTPRDVDAPVVQRETASGPLTSVRLAEDEYRLPEIRLLD